MKKIAITVFSLLFIIVTCACTSNIMTLSFNLNTFDVTENVQSKHKNSIQKEMGIASMAAPYINDKDIYENAENVVRGKVVSTETILDGSTVFTKSNILIEQCYKGNLQKGNKIFVKELGGFISSGSLSKAIALEKFGEYSYINESSKILDLRISGYKVMEKDEEVILFLVPVKNSTIKEFQTNTYEPLRLWQGKLLYNTEYNVYAPYIPSDEVKFIDYRMYTLNEFDEFARALS